MACAKLGKALSRQVQGHDVMGLREQGYEGGIRVGRSPGAVQHQQCFPGSCFLDVPAMNRPLSPPGQIGIGPCMNLRPVHVLTVQGRVYCSAQPLCVCAWQGNIGCVQSAAQLLQSWLGAVGHVNDQP